MTRSSTAVVWTLLAHPDSDRVGERSPVPELSNGPPNTASLSRLQPLFSSIEESRYRALADPHLSRRAVTLRRSKKGIVVDPGRSATTLEVNGQLVTDVEIFPIESLDQGLVFLLRRRVALLLHRGPVVVRSSLSHGGHRNRRLIGSSPALKEALDEIVAAAHSRLPALITGETGTGKELAAQEVHRLSSEEGQECPFVGINMAALSPELAAAELFGAEKGAYTGAARRRGLFRQAEGGTLFLDEIGAANQGVQAMLLRVLEEGRVRPLGSEREYSVSVRVLAATDEDLDQRVAQGTFRRPLLERLRGSVVELPPLRERREDIGRLFYHFLKEELNAVGKPSLLVGSSTTSTGSRPWLRAGIAAALALLPLEGNVRQLKNLANRIVARFAHHERVDDEVVLGWLESATLVRKDEARRPANPDRKPVQTYRDPSEVKEPELLEALREHRFNVVHTATALGLSRTSLYSLIEKSPSVRKGADLERDEILRTLENNDGSFAETAFELEVSTRALKLRIKELGI